MLTFFFELINLFIYSFFLWHFSDKFHNIYKMVNLITVIGSRLSSICPGPCYKENIILQIVVIHITRSVQKVMKPDRCFKNQTLCLVTFSSSRNLLQFAKIFKIIESFFFFLPCLNFEHGRLLESLH